MPLLLTQKATVDCLNCVPGAGPILSWKLKWKNNGPLCQHSYKCQWMQEMPVSSRWMKLKQPVSWPPLLATTCLWMMHCSVCSKPIQFAKAAWRQLPTMWVGMEVAKDKLWYCFSASSVPCIAFASIFTIIVYSAFAYSLKCVSLWLKVPIQHLCVFSKSKLWLTAFGKWLDEGLDLFGLKKALPQCIHSCALLCSLVTACFAFFMSMQSITLYHIMFVFAGGLQWCPLTKSKMAIRRFWPGQIVRDWEPSRKGRMWTSVSNLAKYYCLIIFSANLSNFLLLATNANSL